MLLVVTDEIDKQLDSGIRIMMEEIKANKIRKKSPASSEAEPYLSRI
jgi:hypothetical protein